MVLPPLPRLQMELRSAHRMGRQQLVKRSMPMSYVAYVHEAALRVPSAVAA
ncbi:Scr1 family TA system antitoxin-like transcriptional regulator [Streptomyces sp. NBC_01390]|uniref:Scr1 family TA system antitoxin-like transcriptional regulator n=1 Tax=Streptomyces sp. NBC_01390 TaxID=2903850 RepID=UPI003868A4E6